MEDYQERIITEQKELAEKIVKLNNFISNADNVLKLSSQEYTLLREQLAVMIRYNELLIARILSFREEA